MELDAAHCYRAIAARDPRFDGVFFVGVTTTGVYCRPICPARTPRRDRCTYHRTAAEAERAGFRACFRCRPELAPGDGGARASAAAPASPASVDATARLVARAVARIEAGALDDGSLEGLAAELGVTDRHLRRVVQDAVGAAPIELAQTRRLAMAKQLLHDTTLPLTEVAFASGFASVRRFNAAFRARFGAPPQRVRRAVAVAGAGPAVAPTFELRLGYRAPLDWAGLLGYLGPRAIPGVEEVVGAAWRRAVVVGDRVGVLEVRDAPARAQLVATVPVALAPAARTIAARLRAVFDLDAHPGAIAGALAGDRRLAAAVRARPGLRVPGAFDPFELAVRAVLGQQVSVRGATTLAARLGERLGEPLRTGDPLARALPGAARLAQARPEAIAAIGMPLARGRAIVELARAVAERRVVLDGAAGAAAVVALEALPGIGPWTAQYVAMRALRWPDAFPAGDLGVRKALARAGAAPVTAAEAARRAEAWRPWRAYAVLHLWRTLSEAP